MEKLIQKSKVGSHFSTGAIALVLSLGIGLGGAACSHSKKKMRASAEEPGGGQPVVLNVRAEPSMVSLNQDLDSKRPVKVYADVKSFESPVKKVKLRISFAPEVAENEQFFKNPVEVEMKHLEGTTWEGELSKSDLKKLAVNGQELKYQGQVVAESEAGQIGTNPEVVEIRIQAPAVETG